MLNVELSCVVAAERLPGKVALAQVNSTFNIHNSTFLGHAAP
jgi:hypothetical protein